MLRSSLALVIILLLVDSHRVAEATPTPIVGGTRAPHGKWPDTAAVLMRGGTCSGTLVAPDVVVTAGHCIDSEPYEVVLDSVDHGRTGGERIPVAWSRAYPEWYRTYDIGVVMLARPSKVVPRTITSACTVREELDPHRKVHLVGFGITRLDAEVNTQLHEVIVAVTDPTCTLDPGCQPSIAPHGEFIAGGGGADSCFGDSGGPVYLDLPGGPALVGVVSRGLSLASTPCGGGGIYVRIDKVSSWLQRVTGRKLFRTTCGGKGDDDDDELAEGGCNAGGSAGLGIVVLVGGVMRRRRRRRVTAVASTPGSRSHPHIDAVPCIERPVLD